jgi:hypothetical protein
MTDAAPVRTGRLILVPAVITLAVTLLRLVGELQGWSPRLFSREPGGGGALVGISWLVPVFGAWFGWTLARSGERVGRLARALGLTLLGIAILPASRLVTERLGIGPTDVANLVVFSTVSLVGLGVAVPAWPALGRTLLAYGLAARVPVALVMLVAILGSWGTHYDVMPPGVPEMTPALYKWFMIGLLPQMTIWLWFTVVVGGLFGVVAGAIAGRGR